MKLVCDENIDDDVIAALRTAGHDVIAIAEVSPRATDDQVLATAVRAAALLVTGDKDFGEMVYRLGRASSGVLLLRLAGMSPNDKAKLTVDVLAERGSDLPSAFSVLTGRSLRVRRPS